jgi:isoamylase
MSMAPPSPGSTSAGWQIDRLPEAALADLALGVHTEACGARVGVLAPAASAVWLCLFDDEAGGGEIRLALHGPDGHGRWSGFVPGLAAGQLYGLRAAGEHDVVRGLRFNPAKLLLDPAAREIVGAFEWRPEHHGYVLGTSPDQIDTRDNAASMLKARIAAPRPPLRQPPPRIAAHERVLYEVHVKGFSRRADAIAGLPGLTPDGAGSYAALASPGAIAHFKSLGVTTLSLLPVHYRLNEPMLPAGLVNHWGYNTLGFFCPDPRLAGAAAAAANDSAEATRQFRAMVDALHAAGLEVVLDVVFNHTPEGNEWGPTLAFRGLDEATWYWRAAGEAGTDGEAALANWSACGNTVNTGQPQVAEFVLQALRHWVAEMGVDGFRFDLAAVLGREGADGAFSSQAAFFSRLLADPVLARALLIAEPWDAGPEGYRVGHFPGRLAEWNDCFRDAARGFWLGHAGTTRREFAAAFEGSPAVYRDGPLAGRAPTASLNFITAHDGFTLADLVSFSRKHNRANGEDNRDGRDDEICANFGHEGPSADPAILETRRRVRRALLASLMLAAGTPMLLAGDEFGNSQHGNNNAWNQDNELGWLDWAAACEPANAGLIEYVGRLAALRRAHPALRPASWPTGPNTTPQWLNLDDDAPGPLALRLADLLLVFHPAAHSIAWALPNATAVQRWTIRLDSAAAASTLATNTQLNLSGRSLVLLQLAPTLAEEVPR